jgi:BA14K-like protein
MHNLKVLTTAGALLFVTPVLAQEMGGATGPGSASGYEPTYNNAYYSGYDQAGPPRAGSGALGGNNSYAMSLRGGDCAQRYRSYDPSSGTYVGHDGRRHSCQ